MFLRILSTLLLLTLSCLLVPITAPPPPPYAFYSDVFGPTDPDSSMSVSQLVESRGFALEQYTIATDDEYLLTVHRIVPRHYRPHEYNKARRPVLVSHGLFGSSTDFLINSPHLRSMANSSNSSSSSIYGDNFGFALLQTGRFDVWLTNSRGNEYSQEHLQWRVNEHTQEMEVNEYWNFSFDQMATDLTFVIDKVLEVTNSSTLAFVGYSQGATSMFALLSSKASLAAKIRPFIAWAPVVYLEHVSSPTLRYLAPMTDLLRNLGHRFAPSSQIISSLSHPLCRLLTLESLCTNALFLFDGGFDLAHLNRSRLPTYFHFTPATASTWQIVHYLQLINSGRFTAFDYGSQFANKAHYGEASPPEYKLEAIPSSLPIIIVRSSNDYLSSLADTDRLIEELKERSEEAASNVDSYLVPDPVWAHLDFLLGTKAGKLVYDPTIAFLDRFNHH